MSQPGDIRQTAATALDQVIGLRTHATPPGSITPPAALVQHGEIAVGVAFGTAADYKLQILLLVQLGEFRNSQERVEDLIDPTGPVTTSAVAALLSDSTFGQITVTNIGDYEYGGKSYAAAALSVEAIG